MKLNPSDPIRSHQDPEATLVETEDLDRTRRLSPNGLLKSGVPVLVGRSFGRFQITGLLGVGGMGTVFSAWDPTAEREVALKVLNQCLETPEAREAFLREGSVAAAIRHERVVFVFSAEEVEGRPVLSMELVSGGTLAQKVQRDGPLPAAQVITVLLDLIDALVAAQAVGVLHRDIKPSNCFLDSMGRVKLGDFGISRIGTPSSADSTGKVVSGTPAYGAPEQLLGGMTDVRSDLYSLGATACHLLTGHAPYERSSLQELMLAIDRGGFIWPTGAVAPVPLSLSKAIERCLMRHPQDRFTGYAELRTALDPEVDFVVEPAPKSLRSAAWLIDNMLLKAVTVFVLTPVTLAFALTDGFTGNNQSVVFVLALALLGPAYFIWTESRFGASIGKRILRLRVIAADGSRASIRSNMVRSFVVLGPAILCDWVATLILLLVDVNGFPKVVLAEKAQIIGSSLRFAPVLWMASMFLRSTPGRGWHDVWAGTQVVRRRRIARMTKRRDASHHGAAPPIQPIRMADAKRIGPYLLLEPLTTSGQWLVALDPLLNRRMWIRLAPNGAEPHAHSRRSIHRPGRLRWVNGARTPQLSWDAYEAPDFALWKATEGSPAPWEIARFWLHGAIRECSASRPGDGATAPSGLDTVVLGQAGEFLLLDEPIQELAAFGGTTSNNEAVDTTHPWGLVVDLAAKLQSIGAKRRRQGNHAAKDHPWPWYAARFFKKLAASKEPGEVEAAMRELLARQPKEGFLKRTQLILTSGGIPLAVMVPLMVSAAPPYPLFLAYVSLEVLIIWIGPSLVAAGIAGRRGYAFVREGMQIVDIDGQLATRGRLITRALVAWTPLTAALSIPAVALLRGRVDTVPLDWVRILMLLAIVLGIISSSLRRSLQDRVAGTWLVAE